MKNLSIDIETYSSADLSKVGVYKYSEAEDFEILLFGYSVDHGPVTTVDLVSGEKLPEEILDALTDPGIIKWAFNCMFERVCISTYLRKNYPDRFRSYGSPEDSVGHYLDPSSWRCSMVWSAYRGLPLSLAQVGAVLGLKDQKMHEGKDLIRFFCQPCAPTKSNGGRTRKPEPVEPKKSVEQIAKEVIQGKWGNGSERSERLHEAGYDYDAVQARVNELEKQETESEPVYYTVKDGDTVWGISKKFGTTVDTIQKLNTTLIKNSNLIITGWKIRVK